MTCLRSMLRLVAGLGILVLPGVFVTTAQAQDSDVNFDSRLLRKPAPKSELPEVKPQPQAWPRLDPGAVLCRTEADLDRLTARRHGEAIAGPIDCRVIRDPLAISIIQRNGPGRVEVKVTASQAGDTGWTDAWLPAKAPSGATSASR
jgi:hypothetical protein